MPISTLDNLGVLKDSLNRLSIDVTDPTGTPVDPARLVLTVSGIGGDVRMQDMWPAPANRIVQSSTGNFYVDFGPPLALLNGAVSAGANTLTVVDATPPNTAGWPLTGSIILDAGNPDIGESVNYTAVSISGGVGTVTLATQLQYAHGNSTIITGPSRETNTTCELVLNWQVQIANGDPILTSLQKVKVVSVKEASLLPDLRLMIDKSKKLVDEKHQCFLGYNDTTLLGYLEGGLQNINAYQPSMTFTIDNYPFEYKQLLLDAALITGVMSQELYAIDTDMNYNDQGTSFTIPHQPQLASFLNALTGRLDKLIPQMKLQLLQPGSLHIQMGPNYRLTQLMQAAPNGSIFRGVFFKG